MNRRAAFCCRHVTGKSFGSPVVPELLTKRRGRPGNMRSLSPLAIRAKVSLKLLYSAKGTRARQAASGSRCRARSAKPYRRPNSLPACRLRILRSVTALVSGPAASRRRKPAREALQAASQSGRSSETPRVEPTVLSAGCSSWSPAGQAWRNSSHRRPGAHLYRTRDRVRSCREFRNRLCTGNSKSSRTQRRGEEST